MVDWNKEIYDIVLPLVNELTSEDEDAMDVDAGSGKRDDRLRDKVLIGAVDALQRSFDPEQILKRLAKSKASNQGKSLSFTFYNVGAWSNCPS